MAVRHASRRARNIDGTRTRLASVKRLNDAVRGRRSPPRTSTRCRRSRDDKLRDEIARQEVPGSQNERSSPGTEPHSCKLCFRQLVGQGGPCGADSLWDKVVHVVAGICSLRRSACIQGGRDLHEVNGATRALHEAHLGSLGSEPYPDKMKLLGVSPGSSRRAL